MTLVEAALEILRELKTALTAAQLAEEAVASERIAKASPAQVKALADKLGKLADAGEGIARDGDGFVIANGAGAAKKKAAAKKPAAKKAAAKKGGAKKPAGKKKTERIETIPAVAPEDDDEDDEDDDGSAPEALVGFAEVPAAGVGADSVDDALASDDEDVAHEAISHALSPEEQELAAVYGDELGAPATAHGEYKDARSADEDRPMMPEINAREERHKRWEERKERREREKRERRERRDRGGGRQPAQSGQGQSRTQADSGQGQGHGQGQGQGQGHGGNGQRDRAARPASVPMVQLPAGETGVHRVGTPLGDAAAQVFAQLHNSQPLQVRQLAAMMRKRGLIELDPEQAWPHLKAALLGDERSYRAFGLRPRIVYRGRDLFAPGPVATTALAETSLASALGGLALATHHALKDKIARATPAGFERLIHNYLVAVGFRDIDWVKRVSGISYATALPPDADRLVLISARSGGEPVDRRGIGELRVGVDAKDLLMGMLFAARELSEEAQRELERPGRSVTVVTGDSLVAALIASGVGVISSAAPIRYLDDQLLDELLAGG
jgi:hypothetical protein